MEQFWSRTGSRTYAFDIPAHTYHRVANRCILPNGTEDFSCRQSLLWPPRTADGQPDLQGIWSNASIIPLERPKELEGKQFLTPEEMAAYEGKVFPRSSREKLVAAGQVGTNNDFWWDGDSKRAPNFRTSIIVDPPDGKGPALTPEAQQRVQADRAYAREHPADGPEDRSLMERCILFPMAGPPMLPSFYNNSQFGPLTTNYQIVQTPGSVALLMEVIHDTRIIPLDGRPHLPAAVRQWMGDSRGHWEGNTLVVDTTNFTGKTKFRGADENLHSDRTLHQDRSGHPSIRVHSGGSDHVHQTVERGNPHDRQ